MDSLLPFIGLALLVVLTPGPDLALVTRSVLAGGRRAGLLTALGVAAGAATWALAAAAGLAALLAAAPPVLELIRWLGAGYLAWLGVRALVRPAAAAVDADDPAGTPRRSGMASFRMGLFGNLLHPGQVVFYTSLLPQFLDPAREPTAEILFLGAVFAAIVLAWFTTYAVLAASIRTPRWERVAPVLTRITGIVLLGFAVRLATRL